MFSRVQNWNIGRKWVYEKTKKVMKEGKFPCAIYRKTVGSNYILYQLCMFQEYNKFSSIDRLQQDDEFKCQTWASQKQTQQKSVQAQNCQ